MKPVTIILPTYAPDGQVATYLFRCLDCLKDNTNPDLYELIVVEQKNMFAMEGCSPDLFVYAPKPLGYARAVNIGLKLARTEYVVILNNDVFVPPGWLETMLKDFQSDPRMGVLAPMDGPCEPGLHYNQHWWSCILARRVELGWLNENQLNFRFHDQAKNIDMYQNRYNIARTGNVIVEHVNQATYSKMNIDETEERKSMMQFYDCLEFEEYVRRNLRQ